MNKAFIGVGIALALVGCNNSKGVFPVGIPTIILSAPGSKNEFVPGTPASTTPPITPAIPAKYIITGTLETRSQKGSPAGTVIAFKSEGKELFGGPFVKECPITSKEDCGPFTSNYTLTYYSDPGRVEITSVVVQGLNGLPYEIQLASPIPL
jgi:hypothetical protein